MVACPKCNGELNLPEGADQESIFDCPHCQASYPLSEARLSFADEDGPLLFDLDDDGDDDGEMASVDSAGGNTADGNWDAGDSVQEAELDLELAPVDETADDEDDVAIADYDAVSIDSSDDSELGLSPEPVDEPEPADEPELTGEPEPTDEKDLDINPLLGGAAALGALGMVAKGAQALGDAVVDKASGVADVAGDAIGSVTDAAAGLPGAIGDLPGAVADKASDMVDGAKDLVGDKVESVQGLLGGADSVGEEILDAGTDALDAGGAAIESAAENLGLGVESGIEDIGAAADAIGGLELDSHGLDSHGLDSLKTDSADLDSVDLDAAELLEADDVDDVAETVSESVDSLADLEPSTAFGAGIEPLASSEDTSDELDLSEPDEPAESSNIEGIESAVAEETPEAVEVARADFEIEELTTEEIGEIDESEFSPVSETTETEVDGEFDVEQVDEIEEAVAEVEGTFGEVEDDMVDVEDASELDHVSLAEADLSDSDLSELGAEIPDAEGEVSDLEIPSAEMPELDDVGVDVDAEVDLGLDDDADADDAATDDESSGLSPLLGGAAALGALGAVAKGADIVKGMVGDATKGAADAVGDTLEAGKDAVDNVVEAGADLVGSGGDLVDGLVDGGGDLIKDGTDLVSDTLDSASDTVSDLTGSVSDPVESGVEELLGSDESPEMDLDSIDFDSDDDIEVQFGDAIEDVPGTDDLSEAADAAIASSNADIVGVEDVSPSLVEDAITMEPVSDEAPVEVVKPFDLEPNPDQVPAKNYRPGVPHSGGGIVSSLLKFGIGGLLGLLVAQAGMWWIGRIDPLNLASKLPAATAFLAPDSLRNPYAGETARSTPPQATPLVEANRPPALGEPDNLPADMDSGSDFSGDMEHGFEPVESGGIEDATGGGGEFDGAATDSSGGDFGASDLDDGNTSGGDFGGGDFGSDNGNDLDGGEFATADSTQPEDNSNDVDSLFGGDADTGFGGPGVLPTPTFGLVSKQNVHRNDLSGALGEANRAWDSLMSATNDKASKAQRRALLYSFYDSVANMGQTAVHVDADAGSVVSQMQVFMQSLGRFKATMGKTAARRLPASESVGVFLAGQVANQQPIGSGYQRFQITLPAYTDTTTGNVHPPQTIDVIAPDTSLASNGASVFVLGVRLNEPGSELAGFAVPTSGSVVWSDQIISL